jgi:aurora kinase
VDLKFPATISADAKDLISKVRAAVVRSPAQEFTGQSQLLRYDPQERLALTEVLRHPWIIKYRPKAAVRDAGSV